MTDDTIRVIDESDLDDFEEFVRAERDIAERVARHPDYYVVCEYRVRPLFRAHTADDDDE
jgi:hypothetical protein